MTTPSQTKQERSPDQLLNAWYLAGLRNTANKRLSGFTPGGLINADREHIENLVLATAAGTSKQPTSFRPPPTQRLAIQALAVGVVSITLSIIAQLATGTLSWPSGLTVALCILSIGCIIAVWRLVSQVTAVLNALGHNLATESRSDLVSYQSLPEIVSRLTLERDELASGESLIVDSSAMLLCCLDSEMRVLSCNQQTVDVLGFSKQELIRQRLTDLVLHNDRDELVRRLGDARNSKIVGPLDVRMLSKKRHAIDIRWNIEWSTSNQLYFVMGEDITREKTLDRARKEFISTMGHDIKLPLSAVWLTLQSLGKNLDSCTAKTVADVRRAENNVERLISLIDELLEYERCESHGQLPLRCSSVTVNELVDQAVDAVTIQAQEKCIQFDIVADDLTLTADEPKLVRVIANLLSNAVKFSPANSTVRIKAVIKDGVFEFSVVDRGPGIPEQYRQIIFDRYERVPATSHIEGSGLGLSICKTIVESHGGLIGVHAGGEGGSEFWFTLPISKKSM